MVKQGRILKGIGGFYYVEAEQTIYECKARGVFRKRGTTPLAGDWVQICIDNNTGTIEETVSYTHLTLPTNSLV